MTNKTHILTSLFLIGCFPLMVFCQDVNALFKEAERLEASRKEDEAFRKYQEVLKIQPANLSALCKSSELSCLIGNRQPEKTDRLKYFTTARHFAESALRVNPNYSEANFVMSMAAGRQALLLSGRQKIVAINEIKKYAEIAVRNDPANFKAYHVLGKWYYEVSNLNSLERMFAKLLFGGLPEASFATSIKNYEKSLSLKPDFALNYLELAKAYQKNDQNGKAIDILKRLQSIPVKNADDPRIKSEGNIMLKELQD